MSVGSELDVDLQDLVRVFTHGDGAELTQASPDSDAWADNAGDVMSVLLRMGWLPPTYTDALKREVQTAYAADENDESFVALQRAAGVLDLQLVDPHADGAGRDLREVA